MQEVGLRKGDFSESKVENLSKEPQVPLGGIIGNDHFWRTCGYQRTNGRIK